MASCLLNIYSARSEHGTMASNITLSVIHSTDRQMKKMQSFDCNNGHDNKKPNKISQIHGSMVPKTATTM
jgi:hypothetical protein